jgi:hypothetical protein
MYVVGLGYSVLTSVIAKYGQSFYLPKTERRRTFIKGREAAIITVLADGKD